MQWAVCLRGIGSRVGPPCSRSFSNNVLEQHIRFGKLTQYRYLGVTARDEKEQTDLHDQHD